MRSVALAALVFLAAGRGAQAQDGSVFDQWLSPSSPTCVPLETIKKGNVEAIELTPRQFEFFRGLYIAIPPTSRQLPPGDRAFEFRAGGKVMLGLVTGKGKMAETCARLPAPDFIIEMLAEVATGVTAGFGDGL